MISGVGMAGVGMAGTNIKYMTYDEYYGSTDTFSNCDTIILVDNVTPDLNELRIEMERIHYDIDDIVRMEHMYYLPEDIPKKINFKSIQKLVPVFNRKIINSMSGFRGRSLRRKQSSIYK